MKTRVRWAMAVAGLIIVTAFALRAWKTDPEKIYRTYYHDYPFLMIRGGTPGEENARTYRKAIAAYTDRDYGTSVRLGRELVGKDPSDAQYRFVYAVSLNAMDSTRLAIGQFRQIIGQTHPRNRGIEYAASAWYTGLCYLRQANTDSAGYFFSIAREYRGYLESVGGGKLLEER